MRRHLIAMVIGATAILSAPSLQAETIPLPNHSFESPATTFVNVNIDSWQKSDKPDWYDESGGFFWSQLTGTFKNTAPTNPDHLDNCDGNQAIWLFAVPEVALFQDFNSMDWDDAVPTHAFDAQFDIGNSYDLTVGVMGGSGNMLEGVTLEIALYYRDTESNMVTVAATTITNTLAAFPTNTHLYDYSARVPTVKAGDPWAGQNIGIRLLSTVSHEMQGGYWDLDNVRLSSIRETTLSGTISNGQFTLTLQGEPGRAFEILTSTNLASAELDWMSLGKLTNTSGTTPFIDTTSTVNQRFYRARQLP